MRTFCIAVKFCHRNDLSPIWYVTDLTVTDVVCHRFNLYPCGSWPCNALCARTVWNSLLSAFRDSRLSRNAFERRLTIYLFGHWRIPPVAGVVSVTTNVMTYYNVYRQFMSCALCQANKTASSTLPFSFRSLLWRINNRRLYFSSTPLTPASWYLISGVLLLPFFAQLLFA